MLHAIPENIITTMSVFQIVSGIFGDYPDVIIFLNGRMGTIRTEESLNKKKDEFITLNGQLLSCEFSQEDEELMIETIRKEKKQFRNEVLKYRQVEQNKKILMMNESPFVLKEQEEAENLLISL
ncbi:MAG: hypothetical protein Q8K26_03235 [Candidatus Gracilibacteria bacterium]|nr:hypothetical protein [Candidatus Gracilibacteria bacterium]